MEPRRTHPPADERGISTIEYAVLFALIIVGLLGAWKALNARMNEHVTSSANRLDAVVSAPGPQAASAAGGGFSSHPAQAVDAAAVKLPTAP